MPARQSVEIGHRTSADSGPVGVDAIPQPEASQRRPVGENKQDQAFAVPSPWILPSRTSGMIQASGRSWRTTWSWRAARSGLALTGTRTDAIFVCRYGFTPHLQCRTAPAGGLSDKQTSDSRAATLRQWPLA
jgi:hypothetical protein